MSYREYPLEGLHGLDARQTVERLGQWIRQLQAREDGLAASIEQLRSQPHTETVRAAVIRRRDKLRHITAEREELEGMLEVQVQHMPRECGGSVAQRFMTAALELLPVATLEEIERRAGIAGL